MADQNAAPTEVQPGDTPVEGTAPEAAQENWEERYKEAQAWGTRNAQRAAELEAETQLVRDLRSDDPEAQRNALVALGYQVPEEDVEDTQQQQQELDPRIAAKLAKVDELEQRWNSMTEEQQKDANYSEYREQYDPEIEQMGVPEGVREIVADLAYNHRPPLQTPQGLVPDLKGAFQQVEEMAELLAQLPAAQKKFKQEWANTKPRSPLTSAGGGEGTQVLDLSKHENRVAYALSQLPVDQQ